MRKGLVVFLPLLFPSFGASSPEAVSLARHFEAPPIAGAGEFAPVLTAHLLEIMTIQNCNGQAQAGTPPPDGGPICKNFEVDCVIPLKMSDEDKLKSVSAKRYIAIHYLAFTPEGAWPDFWAAGIFVQTQASHSWQYLPHSANMPTEIAGPLNPCLWRFRSGR